MVIIYISSKESTYLMATAPRNYILLSGGQIQIRESNQGAWL